MKWRSLNQILNWVMMGAAVGSSVLALGFLVRSFVTREQSRLPYLEQSEKLMEEYYRLQNGVEGQREAIQKVNSQIEAALGAAEKSPADVRIAAMRQDIDTLRGRIGQLEGAISESPTKAISLPLLKQDIENVKVSLQREIESSNKQIDRIYDQNKWFIGLMVTMTIGFVSMVIAHVVQLKKAL